MGPSSSIGLLSSSSSWSKYSLSVSSVPSAGGGCVDSGGRFCVAGGDLVKLVDLSCSSTYSSTLFSFTKFGAAGEEDIML